MNELRYDFHIHSCLSPCAENEMTPENIVSMALMNNLDVIAITDHNSARNCGPVISHGEKYGVIVIPGMELTTAEEIHVVLLFEKLSEALRFDEFVYEKLQKVQNRADIFGEQLIYNNKEEIIGRERNLLINATEISFDDVYELSIKYNAVMIPAHVDRSSYSVISNLGVIPDGSCFNNVEISDPNKTKELCERHDYLKKCRILYDSDAHKLESISMEKNILRVKEKNVKEIFNALRANF